MNEHIDISVVIPVHNTGKYLRRCLDSVLSQTLQSFEVICADDGSTDDSVAILKEYSCKDSRFKVIVLEGNHGPAYARNAAMDEARGEYIYFMDSDDWIDPDYLEDMHSHAVSTGLDVVINGHWYIEHEDGRPTVKASQKSFVEGEPAFYTPMHTQGGFFPVVWCRLYKADFLRVNDIRFPPIKGVEDNYFVYLAEAIQGECYVFFGSFYHYFKHKESISATKGYEWYHIDAFKALAVALRERGIPPTAIKRFRMWKEMDLQLNEDKYATMKAFFEDVEDDYRAASGIYNHYERAMIETVLSCPDLKTFRRRYHLCVDLRSRYKTMIRRAVKTFRKHVIVRVKGLEPIRRSTRS